MSVSWFDGVTLTVEIAFTTDPLDPAPAWTDVTDDVRGFSTSAGRSSEFSSISPSTLSITLNNRERQYDPEYASSPYVGDLLPMKKIRVRATYSATTYDLFTGYVQGWPQQYVFHFDSTVTINAVDGSRFLEQAVLPSSAYAAEVVADSPYHYWPLQDSKFTDIVGERDLTGAALASFEANLPVGDQMMLSGSSSAPAYPDTGDATNGYTTLTAANYLATAPRAFECWFLPRTLFATLSIASSTTNYFYVEVDFRGFLNVIFENSTLNRWHSLSTGVTLDSAFPSHIVVTTTATVITVYINGEVEYTATMDVGAPGLGPSTGANLRLSVTGDLVDAVSHVAAYSTAPSDARFVDHYLAALFAFGHPYGERSGARIDRVLDHGGWPTADRELSTGDTVHGQYFPDGMSAMSYLRDVEVAEDGYLFIDGAGNVVLRDRTWQWSQTPVVFSDDGSDTSYDSITIDANSVDPLRSKVSVTYNNGNGYVFSENAAALAAYGPSTEALTTPTIPSLVTARGLAAYKLRTMKDPRTRITQVNVKPRSKPASAFPAVLGLKIGDRANVEITPMDLGSQVVKAVTVQGINHSIAVDGTWDTTLYCSPAPDLATDVPYFEVGDATYGRLGVAAGNVIPF